MGMYEMMLLMENAVQTGDNFNSKPIFIIMGCAVGVAVISGVIGKITKNKK